MASFNGGCTSGHLPLSALFFRVPTVSNKNGSMSRAGTSIGGLYGVEYGVGCKGTRWTGVLTAKGDLCDESFSRVCLLKCCCEGCGFLPSCCSNERSLNALENDEGTPWFSEARSLSPHI